MPGFYLYDVPNLQNRVPSLPPMLFGEPPAPIAAPRPSYSQTPRQRSEERFVHFRQDVEFSLDDVSHHLRHRILRGMTRS